MAYCVVVAAAVKTPIKLAVAAEVSLSSVNSLRSGAISMPPAIPMLPAKMPMKNAMMIRISTVSRDTGS